jgi:SAM-dependent methyltransferase
MWDWEQSYADGFLPWDIGGPSPVLTAFWPERPGERVLELGCGLGHDAVWMASQGAHVHALDTSATALAAARERADAAGVSLVFTRADVLQGLGVAPGSLDLVYDTGLLHHLDADQRSQLAAHIARALRPGGVWLCVSGSAEQPEGTRGPPRRTALELVQAIEPHLAIESLTAHVLGPGVPGHEAWRVVSRARR